YVKASGKPVFDANGEFHGYRGTGTDVTALMRAQEQQTCQIASKCDPLFAAKNDPFDGAETGVAEPHIAEQSRSWRAASGERAVMLGS
ncbi:MAG: hypothetical protein WAL36_10570, partial [Pseudolabrys sp.]